jgi:hypothetical protein
MLVRVNNREQLKAKNTTKTGLTRLYKRLHIPIFLFYLLELGTL